MPNDELVLMLQSEFQQIDKTLPFLDTDQQNTSVPIRQFPQNVWESDYASSAATYAKV